MIDYFFSISHLVAHPDAIDKGLEVLADCRCVLCKLANEENQ